MPDANVREAIGRIEAILKKCTTCGGWCDLVKAIKKNDSVVADLLAILALAKRAEKLRKYAYHLENCATNFCSCCNLKITIPTFTHRLTNICNCGYSELLAALNAKEPA